MNEQMENLKLENLTLSEKVNVSASMNFGFEDELNELGATARLKDTEVKIRELEKQNSILKL